MIFSIQRYLEDYFERRGLSDNDQYAVKVANLYGALRSSSSGSTLRRRLRSIHTVFFRANSHWKEQHSRSNCFRRSTAASSQKKFECRIARRVPRRPDWRANPSAQGGPRHHLLHPRRVPPCRRGSCDRRFLAITAKTTICLEARESCPEPPLTLHPRCAAWTRPLVPGA
jgi:hypothetical protein